MTKAKTTQNRENRRAWKFGSTDEFLGLTPEESAYIDLKLKLAASLRAKRLAARLTQAEIARMVGSSQSRVAKMEACDPTVTIDLLVRSLLALGVSGREIGQSMAQGIRGRASDN